MIRSGPLGHRPNWKPRHSSSRSLSILLFMRNYRSPISVSRNWKPCWKARTCASTPYHARHYFWPDGFFWKIGNARGQSQACCRISLWVHMLRSQTFPCSHATLAAIELTFLRSSSSRQNEKDSPTSHYCFLAASVRSIAASALGSALPCARARSTATAPSCL